MIRKISKVVVLGLFAGLLCSMICITVEADELLGENGIQAAPRNPDFLEYQKRNSGIKLQQCRINTSSNPLGYIPPPVKFNKKSCSADEAQILLKDKSSLPFKTSSFKTTSLPSKYDLRELNRLTPVKDQGNCGSCWAFAAMGSLESYLKGTDGKGIEYNFSEQDLNKNHGFAPAECNGGMSLMSTAYFGRFSGPLSESAVPYPYSYNSILRGLNFLPVLKVTNVDFLPERGGSADNDTIKDFIIKHGAVDFAFYWDAEYYNSNTHSYNSGTYASYANHEVVLVGWDDNYSAGNFKYKPQGDGAWIVKNSWGSYFGEKGYFYLSYYDMSFRECVSYNGTVASSFADYTYDYTPFGCNTSIGYLRNDIPGKRKKRAYVANMFKANKHTSIQAVSFYTMEGNQKWYLDIHDAGRKDVPRSGRRKLRMKGSFPFPGYHTVFVDKPVEVTKGEFFSVTLSLKSSDGYPIPIEAPVYWLSPDAKASVNQSFISRDGKNWEDLSKVWTNANACIQVFAK